MLKLKYININIKAMYVDEKKLKHMISQKLYKNRV